MEEKKQLEMPTAEEKVPSKVTDEERDEFVGRVPVTSRGVLGFILDAWRNNFVSRLTRVVGFRFVLITFILYGLDQGGIHALNELGRVYFFKDAGLEPAETQRAIAWTDMSWNVKPLFGLVMDTVPIVGYHFKPYLIGFGCLGTVAYATIAAVPGSLSISVYILLMFFGMNSVVWNDVALDGVTMQKIKELPQVDTELPSLQQVGLMVTSVVFALFSGFLIEWFGLSVVYGLVAVIAALATGAATMIPETRSKDRFSLGVFWSHVCTIASVFRIRPYMKILAFVAISSFSFDLTGAMTYWYNDVAHFSKGFQGAIVMAGWLVALIAVVINASYLKGVRYRTLMISFQVFQAGISALDLLLVCVAKDAFWGHFIALSDRAGLKAVGKLRFIVIMVAVSEHTPDAGEATATAILAAVSNFFGGDFLAPMAGSWLLEGLNIRNNNFDNLPWAILVRTLVRLVPIFFIPFLVPPGSSADKTRYDVGDITYDIEKDPGKQEANGKASEAGVEMSTPHLDDVDLEGKRPVDAPAVEAPASETDGDNDKRWRVFRSLSSRLYIGNPESPQTPQFGGDDDDFQFVQT